MTTLTRSTGIIPFDAMRDLAGVPPNMRFVCDACSRRSRRRWRITFAVLVVAVIAFLVIQALGIIA